MPLSYIKSVSNAGKIAKSSQKFQINDNSKNYGYESSLSKSWSLDPLMNAKPANLFEKEEMIAFQSSSNDDLSLGVVSSSLSPSISKFCDW